MTASVCEITWGLQNRRLVARCADCDTSYEVTDRAELDGWAREHWLTTHPWAERVRVVLVVRRLAAGSSYEVAAVAQPQRRADPVAPGGRCWEPPGGVAEVSAPVGRLARCGQR